MSQQSDLPESTWHGVVIGRIWNPGKHNVVVADAVAESPEMLFAKAVESIPRNREMLDRRPGAGRPRATTSTDGRYIQLTARRNRTENATQLQRTVALGNRTKGVQPNST
ncbi:hypothetical protein TNCV_3514881 [Trichonephila clavipes]|nr:hypothetical protein TNCV_3514881 [Trichonephila clavipes]